jgi:hydrogenase expression/formation protein HypC
MCLGVPGKVIETYTLPEDGIAMARVDFGGVVKRVCVEHVSEAKVGDYVLVHVGFALARIDEDEARRVLELLEEAALAQELAAGADE